MQWEFVWSSSGSNDQMFILYDAVKRERRVFTFLSLHNFFVSYLRSENLKCESMWYTTEIIFELIQLSNMCKIVWLEEVFDNTLLYNFYASILILKLDLRFSGIHNCKLHETICLVFKPIQWSDMSLDLFQEGHKTILKVAKSVCGDFWA